MPDRPAPLPGIYLQIYRGAIRGPNPQARRDQLARYCDDIAAMQRRGLVAGVVFHGFCEDLSDSWPRLARLATERQLPALAAWGLDGKDLSATRKGELIGQVLASPDCLGGLLDAEGQWDSDLGPADTMDERGALALGFALRSKAPDAWVGDQPWYAIQSHTDVRSVPRPMGEGGTFEGFPVEEFGLVCNWGRFRQAYIYNHLGLGYAHTFGRMDREWTAAQPALARAGTERPLRCTIQGYKWKLHEQVHALLDRSVRAGAPLVMWCSPWPDAVALAAIEMVGKLVHGGFAAPGVDAREAVRAWQRDYNRTAPEDLRIVVDGWAGFETAAAAGIAV